MGLPADDFEELVAPVKEEVKEPTPPKQEETKDGNVKMGQ